MTHSSQSSEFVHTLWTPITPVYDAILTHPFITGLTSGELDRAAFQYYIVQDAVYLREFARALSIAAAKSPNEDAILMFNEHAKGSIEVERGLHETFFKEFGLSEQQVRSTPLAPTNLAYTSYLLAVAYGKPFHEALAALLPCYWIYWEVGKTLVRQGSPDPLYARWIDTYSSEVFADIVQSVLALTNNIAADLHPAAHDAMRHHFLITSTYEWMFWDMAHRREAWPV